MLTAGALALALAPLTARAGAAAGGSLSSTISISGPSVVVHVSNAGPAARTVLVTLRVRLTNGAEWLASARATVTGGGAIDVPFAAPDGVRDVTAVGVVLDDGTPFGPN